MSGALRTGLRRGNTGTNDTLNKLLNTGAFTPSFLRKREPELCGPRFLPAQERRVGVNTQSHGLIQRVGINTRVTDLFNGVGINTQVTDLFRGSPSPSVMETNL